MAQAARSLGLSANGLAKICDRLLIPYPTRGHWGAATPGERPPLPRGARLDQTIVIAADRATSRRRRTRLSPEARRDQLLDAASRLVVAEGLGAVSMKRVAREVGVSEALAFGYFNSRAALLAELARRELAQMRAYQQAEIDRGRSSRSRVALSTRAYLTQIEARGSVLHLLLGAPEVRALLRPERRAARGRPGVGVAGALEARYGVAADFAHGATQALTAATRRAGHLLALRRLSREAAERLVMAMVERANRDLVNQARSARRREGPAAH